MPEKIKERDNYRSFAVIDQKKDFLALTTRAKKIHQIKLKYPEPDYKVWDITGNDEVPVPKGGTSKDITIDENGDWKVKTTQEQIANRKKQLRIKQLKLIIVELNVKKDKAETMGSGYTQIVTDIEQNISIAQKELDELEGS